MNMLRKLAAIALLLLTASFADAAIVKHWNAGGTATNLNWSLGVNWDDGLAPIAISQVYFENASAPTGPTNVVGAVNNIVNANTTVNKLNYNAFWLYNADPGLGAPPILQSNAVYTTLIPANVTLVVSNTTANTPVFTVGDVPDGATYYNSGSAHHYTTITGPGAMNIVAKTGFMSIGSIADNAPTLDMTGLSTFTADVGMVRMAALNELFDPSGNGFSYSAAWFMTPTNNITARGWSGGSGPGILLAVNRAANVPLNSVAGVSGPVMFLGVSNTFNTVGFTVGGAGARNSKVLWTNSNPNNIFKLRGTNGTSPVPILSVGDLSADVTNYSPTWRVIQSPDTANGQQMDLTRGTVDITADAIYLGRSGQPTAACGTAANGQSAYEMSGKMWLGNGTVTATNLYFGHKFYGGPTIPQTNQSFGDGYLYLLGTKFTVYNNVYWLDRTNSGSGSAYLLSSNDAVLSVGGNLLQGQGTGGSGSTILAINNGVSYWGGMYPTNQPLTLVASNGGQIFISNSVPGYANNQITLVGLSSRITVNGNLTLGQITGEGIVTNVNNIGTITVSNKNNAVNCGTLFNSRASLFLGGNVNLANVTNLTFDLSPSTTVGSGINDYIKVPGNVTFPSGTPMTLAFNYTNGLVEGNYVLMDWGSTNGLQPTNLYPIITRANIYVTNDPTVKQLQLVVTNLANALTLYWHGVGTNANGVNWTIGVNTLTNGSPAPYYWSNINVGADVFKQFDAAVFDETVWATNNFKATQDILVGSGGLTFNNTNFAVTNISGNKIYGQGGITKNGPGWLVLNNANDLIGPVQLNGGVTFIGQANALGTLPQYTGTVTITNNAALSFSAATAIGANSGSASVPPVTSVARNYILSGTGNNNSGAIFYTNVTSSTYTINNSGITLGDDTLIRANPNVTVTASKNSALLFQGIANVGLGYLYPSNNYGVNPAVLDLKGKTLNISNTANYLVQSGSTIQQTGAVAIAGMKITGNGTINVNAGTLWLGSGNGADFIDNGTIVLSNNTILRLSGFTKGQGATGYVNSAISVISNAMIMQSDKQAVTSPNDYHIPFGGLVQIGNNGTLIVSNYVPTGVDSVNTPGDEAISFNGQISGSGATLIKGGLGTLTLTANEAYTGGTYINDGVLFVGNNMSFASSNLVFGAVNSTNNYLDTTASSGGLVVKQTFVPPSRINGKLTLDNNGVMGNGALTVAINGSLMVTNGGQITPGTTYDTGTIIVTNDLILAGDGSNTNFFMNIGPSTNKSDQIYVKGNLILSNNVHNIFNIDTLGGFAPNGTNILIQYSGKLLGGGGLGNITNINPTSRFYVHFLDPATTTNLDGSGYLAVVLTTPPANLTWMGWDNLNGNTNWNVKGASNWSNGGLMDQFFNGDRVTFDDQGLTKLVYMTNNVGPDTMLFTNTTGNPYTLAGPGYLLGGSLTNNGLGGVFISNSAPINYLVGLGLYNGASSTTTFQQPTNSQFTGDLVGPGAVVMAGANTLTINAQDPDTFTGNFNVNSGIVRPAITSVTNAFGNVNGLPHVNVNGGVFDLNGSVGDKEKVFVQGAGPVISTAIYTNIFYWTSNDFNQTAYYYATNTYVVTNQLGAVDNRGLAQTRAFTYVSLTGDAVFGASNADWYVTSIDPNGLAAGTFQGNSHNLTKIGYSNLWIEVGSDLGVSNIVVAPNSGKLIFGNPSAAINTTLGPTNGTITVCSNSMIGFADGINANTKPMIVQGGGSIYASGYSNSYAGNITISNGIKWNTSGGSFYLGNNVTQYGTPGPNTAIVDTNCVIYGEPNAQLTLSGNISGPGKLTVDAVGSIVGNYGTESTVTLSGTNSYTGGTLIQEGTLVITKNDAFVQNTNIVLYGHVTANVSGWPRLNVVGNISTPANVGAQMYVDSDGTYALKSGYIASYGNWGACEIGGDGATWNGSITIQGSPTNTTSSSLKSVVSFRTGTNGFTVNGPINGAAFYGTTAPGKTYVYNGITNGGNGGLMLNGISANPTNGAGPAITFNGPLFINGSVQAVDWFADPLMTKVVLATNGNNWDYLIWQRGMMVFGANNALPVAPILFGHGFPGGDHRTIFDLNGHNQSVNWVQGQVGDEACWFGNGNNATSDATLTYVGYSTNVTGGGTMVQTNLWNYFIVDSLFTNAVPWKTKVSVTGGYLQLSAPDAGWTSPDNTNGAYLSGNVYYSMIPYTGATTVSGGTLDVAENLQSASITVTGTGILRGLGSSVGPVNVSSGGTLEPGSGMGWVPIVAYPGLSNYISTNTIGTFTVSNNVTIAATGNGMFNVDNAYGMNDQLVVTNGGTLTYGGILTVNNVSYDPVFYAFQNNQAIPLFSAGTYAGTVPTVLPAAPAPGLVWNTSTLMTDGNLRVSQVTTNIAPTIARTVSGSGSTGTMTMSWPQNYGGYRLQVQTNLLSVGLKTNAWVDWPNSTNVLSITVPTTNNPTVFFRLVYP
jgi:autotransporter-associated beta strand protein